MLALTSVSWAGRADTTLVKMSSDMPLPMPRWVINSPIHINRAVPVVRVRTTTNTDHTVKLGSRSIPPTRAPLWNRNAKLVDWRRAMPTVR